eukprot:SAG11_NODE_28029_length_326_cov_0.687225_1_plen_108_part_11
MARTSCNLLALLLFGNVVLKSVAQECSTPMKMTPPDGYQEYLERFDNSYSNYHKKTLENRHLAVSSSEEVLDAQEMRNALRAVPRTLEEASVNCAGLKLSTRCCGLRY